MLRKENVKLQGDAFGGKERLQCPARGGSIARIGFLRTDAPIIGIRLLPTPIRLLLKGGTAGGKNRDTSNEPKQAGFEKPYGLSGAPAIDGSENHS